MDSILIINTFGIGDVLFSTPLIRNIKAKYPACRIYYMCNRKTEPLLKAHPLVHKVFVYERDEFVAAQRVSWFAGLKAYYAFIRQIRAERIDSCIDLSLNTPFGFFAWAAGIKRRYGLNYKNRGRFLNHKLDIDGFSDKHVVEYYLSVLSLLGIPAAHRRLEVFADEASRKWAADFLGSKGISHGAELIGIAPCGGDAFGKDAYVKRWPARKFSQLIDRLTAEGERRVLILAGPKEKQDVSCIIGALSNPGLCVDCSDLSLPQTVAVIEKCRLFIGNDTGPLRFADGLNKKLVAIFGPVDEAVYGPYPYEPGRTAVVKHDIPCRPCYRKFRLAPCGSRRECMEGIPVETVLEKAEKLMGGR